MDFIIAVVAIIAVLFCTAVALALRYKRCPSDKILVVYGKVGKGKSAECHHGGAAFIWPIIQDYQYLDLTPLPIDIRLEGALSKQNIRVNTPSTFTVGVSTEPGVMENAAERMLGLNLENIKELAKDIIFGQMRVVIATMDIEEIEVFVPRPHGVAVGPRGEYVYVGGMEGNQLATIEAATGEVSLRP